MTDEQIIAKLAKTLDSINAHQDRGGTTRSQRAWDLVRRYDDLKDAVTGERGYTPAWTAYCASINACRSHTGIDLYNI
jgi:hypothetical protein